MNKEVHLNVSYMHECIYCRQLIKRLLHFFYFWLCRGFAPILGKTFLQYIAVLVAFISINTVPNLSIDNPVAWNAFLVAQLFAFMAWCKIKLASRNTSELPITSNQITRPISNFIFIPACIFLMFCFLAIFFLSFILHPLLGWLICLCLPLFLLDKIPHSSYYYQKVVEWLTAISCRFQQIFRPSQQAEAAPQTSNETPPTAV
jgi:hypothetical protein